MGRGIRDKNRYRPIPRDPGAGKDVQALIETVEVLVGARNDPMYRALTPADLVDAGFEFNPTGNGAGGGRGVITIPGGLGTTLPDKPTKAENLNVAGSFTGIGLTWDRANYRGHAGTEVYRSGTNDFGTAVLIATVLGRSHTDHVVPGSAYYYWIRFVNEDGDLGPLNSTQGTYGATSLLVTDIIQATNDLLNSDDLTPGIVAPPGGSVAGLAQEIIDRIAGDASLADDDLLLEIQILAQVAQGDATDVSLTSQIITEQTVRADADSAMASDITLLQSSVDGPNGVIAKAIALEQWQTDVVNDPDGTILASSTRISALEASVGNGPTGLDARATVLEEAQAIISDHIAANYSITTTVDVGGNTRVTGMKILNQVGQLSKIIFNTDVFSIAPPLTGTGADLNDPGTPVFTVGPYTDPATQITTNQVVMNKAVIGDLTVGNAAIQELTADKITITGVPGNPSSIAEVLIGNAEITDAMIGNVIQSTVYSPSQGIGWRISKNGAIDAAAITIRDQTGQIILTSGGVYSPDIANSNISLAGLGYLGAFDATRNTISNGAFPPTLGVDGDIHYNGTSQHLWMKVNGSWLLQGTVNQGQFATLSGKLTEGNFAAYVAAQSITGTYIKDLTVDTLKLAGNAVTVPTGISGTSRTFTAGNTSFQSVAVGSVNPQGGKAHLIFSANISASNDWGGEIQVVMAGTSRLIRPILLRVGGGSINCDLPVIIKYVSGIRPFNTSFVINCRNNGNHGAFTINHCYMTLAGLKK